jgi:hypothetical protein
MMLEGPDGPVEDTKGMISLAVSYYKNLYGFEEKLDISLVDDFWHDSEKVSKAQNETLNADFTEQEVKDAIFGSYALLDLMISLFFFINISGIWSKGTYCCCSMTGIRMS